MNEKSFNPESSLEETIVSSINEIDKKTASTPCLLIIAGQHIGKLFPLDRNNTITVGRSSDCEIWIEDNTISRRHFQIGPSGNTFMISDLKSTNGTYVNHTRIETASLHPGDKIQISKDTIIQFDLFDEDQKLSEQKRYEMGVKDPFTGAFNKSYFLQRISDEFSFSYRQEIPLSIILFDIDHFKLINDTNGHLAGDQILQEVSQLVFDSIRNDDVFCRYGGEEFVVIMRNTGCQAAVNLAERLRLRIEKHKFHYENTSISVTISAGVATLTNKNFRDYVAMIAEADNYLYKSKGSGRNQIQAVCQPQIES